VEEIEVEKDKYENVVKIRCPWSEKVDWIGDWSDSSNLWRDDLTTKLNYHPFQQEKAIWMKYSDFKFYFSRVNVCHFNANFKYTSIKLKQEIESFNLIQISIRESGNYYISINQKQSKYKENPNNYLVGRMIVCKYKEKQVEYEFGKMGDEKEIFEQRYFETGDYIIYIQFETEYEDAIYNLSNLVILTKLFSLRFQFQISIS
jgi:hypothetical protein